MVRTALISRAVAPVTEGMSREWNCAQSSGPCSGQGVSSCWRPRLSSQRPHVHHRREQGRRPNVVPTAGGSVTYTIGVQNTGTGFFQQVNVVDDMVACTLGAPTGDDGDGDLESGETWSYSCVVDPIFPGQQNTANVNACHNASGACNQSSMTLPARLRQR